MDDFRIESLHEGLYEAVATLFNESDDAWPGGLIHGNPMNRERIARRYSDMEVVEVLVGMVGDKAVGVLEIAPFHAERSAAYVNFLNAHPAHHGKSYGRRLLQRAVEIATARGFERLDLFTWAGNMKAVPAYKKTGFFWYPGTSVYMQNFLPQILTAPPLKAFFEKNDWYKAFRRSIEVGEDLERKSGRRVYTYRFGGDEALEVRIDVLASRMCSVKKGNDEWTLETEGEELFVGYPKTVGIASPGGCAHALSCKEGYAVSERPRAEPETGKSVLVSTTSTAPRLKEEERAEALDALFETSDGRLHLGVGFYSRLPVEASFFPSPGILPSSGEAELELRLCNQMDAPLVQTTRLKDGTGSRMATFDCALAPLERRLFKVRVEGRPGMRVTADTAITDGLHFSEPVPFLSPGRLMPDAEAYCDRLLATDGRYLLEIEPKKGARMTLRQAGFANAMAGMVYEEIGPPFRPGQMRVRAYAARTEETPDGLRISLESESERPKLKVARVVELLKDGTIEISRTVRNFSADAARFQLMHTGWTALSARRAMSTPHGAADFHTRGDYPGWQDDLPITPESHPECWTFSQGNGGTLGVAWSKKGLAEVRMGSQSLPDLIWRFDIPQGGEAESGRVVFLPNAPSPDVARCAASKLNGPLPPKRTASAPLDIAVEPWPLLAPGKASMRALSLRESEIRGSVRWLSGGRTLASLPLSLRGFGSSSLVEFEYAPGPRGAEAGELVIATELEEVRTPLPAACISGEGKESVEPGRPWVVGNGLLELRADPAYCAAMHSLRRVDTGFEYLSSPYPEITELAWFRPWRGGFSLFAFYGDSFPGRLGEESWAARPIRGLLGNCEAFGVRMTATLAHSDREIRGIVIDRDYLTARGSPLVVARTTLRGMGAASVGVAEQIFTSFRSPESVFDMESAGADVTGLRHRTTRWIPVGEPVVIRSGVGPAMVFYQHGSATQGHVMDLGLNGIHYESYGEPRVASEPFTLQIAVAACADMEEASRWKTAVSLAASARFDEIA